MKQMSEYEIYLPLQRGDGTPVPAEELDRIKEKLVHAFGGYTDVNHRMQGAWRIGGVTMHNEITILRVLDEGGSDFDLGQFKTELEQQLQQQSILIISRTVSTV